MLQVHVANAQARGPPFHVVDTDVVFSGIVKDAISDIDVQAIRLRRRLAPVERAPRRSRRITVRNRDRGFSVTHRYCVLPHHLGETMPAEVTGVAGSAVRALILRNMVAWISEGVRAAVSMIDAIRAHNDVVEVAMTMGSTPIPARFGQLFENDQACVDALAGRGPSVEALLAVLQGCVEMTILVTPSTRRILRDLEPLVPEMFEPTQPGWAVGLSIRCESVRPGPVQFVARPTPSLMGSRMRWRRS